MTAQLLNQSDASPPPGLYDGVVDYRYHNSAGISVSSLKVFAKAPAKLKAGPVKEETAAMQMGSLVHTAILEPQLLEARYKPTDLDRRGTKAWDLAEEGAGGRELIKREDWDAARRMRDAAHAHPTAAELLKPGLLTEQ